jgi:hypothetical protein
MSQEKCPYCGGSEIVANIRVSQTAEVGKIGLSFKMAKILVGTEPFLADLCNGCGSIRLRVQNTDRKWLTVK